MGPCRSRGDGSCLDRDGSDDEWAVTTESAAFGHHPGEGRDLSRHSRWSRCLAPAFAGVTPTGLRWDDPEQAFAGVITTDLAVTGH